MSTTVFSVERLARLCGANPETIRRWRIRGVKGVRLEATESTLVKGKPIFFTKEAILRFSEAYPKIMTPALKAALYDESTASAQQPSRQAASFIQFSDDQSDNSYMRQMLLERLTERRGTLTQELEKIERSLDNLNEQPAFSDNESDDTYMRQMLLERLLERRSTLTEELEKIERSLNSLQTSP